MASAPNSPYRNSKSNASEHSERPILELYGEGLQQDAITLDGLTDMQASLNFPNASRNRLYDRNAKVLFKRRHDTEHVPARS